jgi:hypothetical protein
MEGRDMKTLLIIYAMAGLALMQWAMTQAGDARDAWRLQDENNLRLILAVK